ncbi:MAG: type VII toxin-antitoxin system HepT family RNase toxin [Thiohalospira sp.]
MDRRVVEQKLESLRYCIQRVAQRCPATPGELHQDADTQDILALNLSRAVQQCVDIGAHLLASLELQPPNTMGETFDRLTEANIIEEPLADRLKKAVGFRNIAVHNYERIDWEIVHSICSRHLDDFRNFARIVYDRLS